MNTLTPVSPPLTYTLAPPAVAVRESVSALAAAALSLHQLQLHGRTLLGLGPGPSTAQLLVDDVISELEVRQAGVLGLVDDDTVPGLIHVVIQTEECRHPEKENIVLLLTSHSPH